MNRSLTIVVLLLLVSAFAFSQQLSVVGEVNAYTLKTTSTLPDTLKPYLNDQGVRTVWVDDIDKDGTQELFTTDYSNGGRVHMFKMTTPGVLELVWSSARMFSSNGNSTPRWIRTGDLDGDGNREVIFPLGGRYTGEVEVYEWDGTSLGTAPAITLPAAQFIGSGLGNVRMDREAADVSDYDGDGRDELITANQNNKVYVFGVNGEFPGFGAWQIEGGDPAVVTENGFSAGSWWHSVPADINGDGKKEIVNQYWNFYGFWSLKATGPDTYRYPAPVAESKSNFYYEFLKTAGQDATAYMGVQPADVDGDGKQEIAGIIYIGNDPYTIYDYSVGLVSAAMGDTSVYLWKDSTQFGLIGTELWKLAGKSSGSHWAIGAYDFNGNGRDEVYVGGSADYNVVSLEYKGTGNIHDQNNYDKKIVFAGDKARYHNIDYYDSLGVKMDTVYAESPFLSKMFTGCDLNKNGKKEIALSYQSIADSITYRHFFYDSVSTPKSWKMDSTWKVLNTNVINIRVLEWTATGFKEVKFETVTPDDYVLEQNYPNPFNPSTSVRFSLPVDKKVSLVVYDMLGKEVKTLVADEFYKKGSHQISWNGTNNHGYPVASGNYVYTLKFGGFSKSAKMTLIK